MTPKISIIVPVYDVELFLKQCLDSIVNQTLKDIEIIIVNDCSPGNEDDIIKSYMVKDPRVKYIKNIQNVGLGQARNIGQKEATGDYIMFVDSDDYIMPDLCNNIVKVAEKYHAPDIIEFKFATCDTTGNNITNADWLPKYKTGPVSLNNYWMLYATCVWCRAFKSSFIKKYTLVNSVKRGAEDIVFTQPAFRIAKTFVYLDYVGYVWRTNNNSLSRQKRTSEQQYSRFMPILQELKAVLLRLGVYNQTEYNLQCINILMWDVYSSGRKWYNIVRKYYRNLNCKKSDFEKYNYAHLYQNYKTICKQPYYLYRLKNIRLIKNG